MNKKTMQQKRQSMVKNKSEIYPQKSLNLGQKSKSRGKSMNGKIKVVVRKRPISELEKKRKDLDIITVKDSSTIYIDEPRYKVDLTKYVERHEFIVDKVFDETVDNFTVYINTIKPLIVDIFESNCVCSCFAYGQTGSGKTYTMLGSQPYGQSETPGIFQYAAEDIFSFLNLYDHDNSRGIFISFYEIYCGKLYDLLQKRKMVAALENGKKEVIVKDLKILRVYSKEELISKMIDGVMLRKIGVNSQNDESSRSHAILNIDVKDIHKNISLGKIAFIDLAGSERGADTVAQNKQTQTDGANINRSLLALKECIRAMDSDKHHIPFRDSELTKVLRDIFVGKSKSIMIANISPTISCCEQTLNTLRYSSRVKNFKHKMNATEEEDPNSEKISILESRSGEMNTSGAEGAAMKSNSLIQSGRPNIKSNELKDRRAGSGIVGGLINSSRNGKHLVKNQDALSINQTKYSSVNDMDKLAQKKKKKKSLLNFKSNNTNYDNISGKENFVQQNYAFSDTSDFSSLDEMNCNLNKNDKNMFLACRKNAKQGVVKNRSSCDGVSSKTKKADVQVHRHSVGSKLTNFFSERERLKERSFFRGNGTTSSGNASSTKHHIGGGNGVVGISALQNNTDQIHMRHGNEREKNRDSDNIFYDAISNTSESANRLLQQSVQNTLKVTEKNQSGQHGNSPATGMTQRMSYDYNQTDRSNSFVGMKERPTKGTSLFINCDTESTICVGKENLDPIKNFSNIHLHTKGTSFEKSSKDVNYHAAETPFDNTNGEYCNVAMMGVHEDVGLLKSGNLVGETSNEFLPPSQNYGEKYDNNIYCQNSFNHNSGKSPAEVIDINSVTSEECHKIGVAETGNGNSQNVEENEFSPEEHAKQFQKNLNNMVDNCLNTLNIGNLCEDTQNILNNILLSKYTADKEMLIKKYIDEDVKNMSLEKLDKYAQLIYEKRKTILTKLLFLFKRNVDVQTNNETSDLKKDLVMCHICSNNPDDQFHFYAYSRLEKDMINLITLRQLWCESENLRQLHQYLMVEYQNKSANLITFNVFPNKNSTSSLNKKYVEDAKGQSEAARSAVGPLQ
ncbi:kinesin-13, putative [Plasmodium knowlesi strain H]|uniref:Kinesin-13, putative n=3 Tax=Plasmodium knowlesi TaxID=5850 RepID=A0A1A7W573_PLAKH|nr:kinesin-13, putative [Plasmodium knowlesi strain H]OTN63591.1 putative Kinesin-13 [Plasmodium knowlesi]CAA9991245.1 kinesin-13, putative [Plasmodium knowlesi strain H]SBO26322.1 kinesin-13, putative [Plasmodium knowlesi strain H]SBO29047.1 kinesin-13, putative [Plasmodium knowlesi strain H]VVS80719.1 kinesin-13, putative [Plasmodium knowlesi strain H]